jgi:hypothetical protein
MAENPFVLFTERNLMDHRNSGKQCQSVGSAEA